MASIVSLLNEVGCRQWKAITKVCQGAAVFVDDGSAELLHWAGGVEILGGCVGVYDIFSELNPVAKDFIATAPYSHVIIIVSSFLHGPISERIAKILSDLQPLECHVFTSQSEEMHAQLIPMLEGEVLGNESGQGLESYSHFGEFQALMRKWINREAGVRVSVDHIPLFQAEICQGLITTPPYSTLFPLTPSDLIDIQARLLNEGDTDSLLENLNQVDFDMLTWQFQTSIKGFASGLNYFLKDLNVGEELFSLGPTSRFIANQLGTMPAAKVRRKTASHKCSLLLIDRSLDLTGCTLHPVDSLADRILSILPRTSPLASNVSIDMSPLISAPLKDSGWVLNGTLAHPRHPKAKELLKTIIHSTQKDSLMAVSRCLLDCLSQENISLKLSGKLGRPSALQLKTFIQQFKDCPQACVSQHAVLELSCAVVQALEGDINRWWDRLSSIEKVFYTSLHDKDSPSVTAQLTEEAKRQASISSNPATPLSLSELLGVGVGVFSLVGEEGCVKDGMEEKELKEALADLAIQQRECDMKFLKDLGISQSDSHSRVVGRFGTVLQRLEGLGTARNQLIQFRKTFSSEDPSLPPYHSLLSQVTKAIFDSGVHELPDLNYHSQATITNLLKSGIGLFVGSARPLPSQQPLLLLFVVGGISCSEIHQIMEIVTASRTDVKVIIGATRLITSHDITKQVLCKPNS